MMESAKDKNKGFNDQTGDLAAKLKGKQALMFNFAEQLIKCQSKDDVYNLLLSVTKELEPQAYILVSGLAEDGKRLQIKNHWGFESYIQKIVTTLDFDPQKMKFAPEEMSLEQQAKFTAEHFVFLPQGLYQLFSSQVPQELCQAVEQMLEVDKVYSMGFSLRDVPQGGLTLFVKEGWQSDTIPLLEHIIRLAALSLEQLQTKIKLQEREYLLKQVEHVANQGSFRWFLDTNEVIWSENLYHIYGYDPALGQPNYDWHQQLLSKADWQRFLDTIDRALKNKSTYSFEAQVITADGQKKDILSVAKPNFNSEGQLWAYTGFTRDITHEKEAEKRLHFQARLLDTVEQGVIVTNLDGNIIYWNPFAEKLYGWTAQETIGKKAHELIANRLFDKQTEKAMVQLKAGKSYSGEFLTKNKQGQSILIHSTNTPIYNNNGCLTHIIEVSKDIGRQRQAEQEIIVARQLAEENARKFKDMYENTSIGIAVVSMNFTIMAANKAYCQMLGYTEDELLGLKLSDITHPETLADNLELQKQLGKGLISNYQLEKKFVHKNGSVVYGLLNATLIKNLEGKPLYFLGNVQDITQKKIAEKALKESENLFRSVFTYAGVGIAMVAPDGTFLRINNKFCEMLGYTKEEFKDMSFRDITHPEDLNLEEGYITQVLTGEIDRFSVEKRYFHKNGNIVWINLYSSIVKDEQGQLLYAVAVTSDITKRKLLEKRLLTEKEKAEDSEKQFRQLFENMEQGFALHQMIYDEEGRPIDYRFILINKAFERLTGIKAGNFIGKRVKEVLPATEDIWIKNYGKVAQTGHALQFENYSQEFDKYYEVIAYSPKKDFFAVVFTDVTRNKIYEKAIIAARQRAEESDRLKTAFLNNVSHEFRTPMNGILGFTELIVMPDRTPEQRQTYSKVIQKSCQRLLSIVTDTIDIAEVQSHNIRRYYKTVDLKSIIDEVVEQTIPKAQEKELDLQLDIQYNNDNRLVTIDAYKLKRILLHLLDNAVKFTHQGFVSFTGQQNDRYLIFEIEDSGIGISKEMQGLIFQPFRQGQQANLYNEGNGIGLALVKAYIDVMDGKIKLDSTIDKGTKIHISLPLAKPISNNEKLKNNN